MGAAQQIFAACAPGLEAVLADELIALGLQARPVPGGAEASGEDAVAIACIGARVADAVALRLYRGPSHGLDRAIVAGRARFGMGAEFAVRRAGAGSTLSIDAAGSPLFRRGWRARVGAAPLRESLAAGMLLAAGYDGSEPLLDPMCGSGTLPLEAAAVAARHAPGLERHFAFEDWPGHEKARTHSIRSRFASLSRTPTAPIHGSDRNAGVLRLAAKNATDSGLAGFVRFERVDAARVPLPASEGLLAVNPPYGVRLGEETAEAWRALACLFERAPGWRAIVLGPDRGYEQLLPRSPTRTLRVRNGGLSCQFLLYGRAV